MICKKIKLKWSNKFKNYKNKKKFNINQLNY